MKLRPLQIGFVIMFLLVMAYGALQGIGLLPGPEVWVPGGRSGR